jgi:hypothetical protein
MGQRIKGQETELILVEGGQELRSLSDVKSFEITAMLEILTEGYIGETSDRKDEVFKGMRGRMELHFETRDVLDFMVRIINRAARREPGVQINAKTTLQFPDGNRVRVLVKNVFFGEIPMGFASRTDYGSVSLDFESGDRVRVI